MKSKIEFNLNDPEDVISFEIAVRSRDIATVLWEITTNTKKGLLSGEYSEEFENGVEAVYKKLYEILDEYSINVDRLVN